MECLAGNEVPLSVSFKLRGPWHPSLQKALTVPLPSDHVRHVRWLDFDGKRLSIAEWAKIAGLTAKGFAYRIDVMKLGMREALRETTIGSAGR